MSTVSPLIADSDTPLIHQCWYVAGTVGDFTRELRERYLLGKSVLLFRSRDDQPVVLQNRCSHRSFPLHHGQLEGDEVVCMYHGLRFDTQGRCVLAPMIGRAAEHARIHRYPTAVRGPLVWVWMGDPAHADEADIPDIGTLHHPDWVSDGFYLSMQANYVGLHENLMDLTHLTFLHAGNVGTPEWANSAFEVTIMERQVRTVRVLKDSAPPTIYAVGMKLEHREKVNRSSDAWYISPALNMAHIEIEDTAAAASERRHYRVKVFHFLTPETQHSVHYHAYLTRDYALGDPGVTSWLLDSAAKAFHEDKDALEWIEQMNLAEGRPPVKLASFATDRGSLAVRKILKQLADNETA